jgi:hypothetical protein
MFEQDLFFHDGSDASVAIDKFVCVFGGLDLVPVNGGIASQHAEALGCGEFLINGANERKKLLIEARVTAHRLRGISPRFAGFGERHIFSSDVTVENRLIERIAAFDCDVINLYGEGRIADEGENEVI